MNLYNSYVENVKKSKQVALGLLEDNKDIYDSITEESRGISRIRLRDSPSDFELAGPSTSRDKPKRPTEFVKYGKITFDTKAILHHYPQSQNKNVDKEKVATKKSDLNLPVDEIRLDNNNDVKSENKETKVTVTENRVNSNNNEINQLPEQAKANCVVKSDNTVQVLKNPKKFTEEKLV